MKTLIRTTVIELLALLFLITLFGTLFLFVGCEDSLNKANIDALKEQATTRYHDRLHKLQEIRDDRLERTRGDDFATALVHLLYNYDEHSLQEIHQSELAQAQRGKLPRTPFWSDHQRLIEKLDNKVIVRQ